MQSVLPEGAKPSQLRPGVQQAIAASVNDSESFAVEYELVSILDGPAFRGSSRSKLFLRYVVEETLAGRQEALKERTIGIAVLSKASDYDTGADSSVRVRANEVRKRLASHYDAVAPKAGIRIELPLGTYVPRFAAPAAAAIAAAAAEPAPVEPRPPEMLLWQLAAPTLIAVFLALIAIRGGVESNDAFSRFWNHAISGRTEIVVAVDSDAGAAISPLMADAALPFEALAGALQTPVHIMAVGGKQPAGSCVIRLSLTERPSGHETFRVGAADLFRGNPGEPAMWLWAKNAEALRSAAQILTSRSAFPDIE